MGQQIERISAIVLILMLISHGNSYDVIIVGGGIAGVKAAVDLANSGKKVIILEANDYLGGRLLTRELNLQDGQVFQFDEGASWIHGNSEGHPITQLAQDVQELVTADTDDGEIIVYDLSSIDVSSAVDDQSIVYDTIAQSFSNLDPSVSVLQAITDQDSVAPTQPNFMFGVSNNIEFETSGSIDVISASGYNDQKFDGTQTLILSGYQKFVDTLAKKATFEVRLNHKVIKIVWQGEIKNRVICQNGIEITGSYILIGVPLGVLKAGSIVFQPELPDWKKQAINSIGFGNVCKILLDFANNVAINYTQHYLGVVDTDISKRGLATYNLNIKQLANVPALMTFGLGANADEAQSMTDADLKTLITARLNIILQSITDSDYNMYKTSWRSKQNFRGAYSFASITTNSGHWENMQKSIPKNQWYFCGEHTYQKYRGTVHGAYLSGKAAATSIIIAQSGRLRVIIGLSIAGALLLIGVVVIGTILYCKYCTKNKNVQTKQSKNTIEQTQENLDEKK